MYTEKKGNCTSVKTKNIKTENPIDPITIVAIASCCKFPLGSKAPIMTDATGEVKAVIKIIG